MQITNAGITNADYRDAKIVWKDFEIKKKKLVKCHDLYVRSDTVVLADIFENFWNMCLGIYGLDPDRFLLHQD